MSTELQKQPETVESSTVLVCGASINASERTGEKLVRLVVNILDFFKEHSVFSVVFNEGDLPKNDKGETEFSAFYIPVRAMVINLRRHITDAISMAKQDNNVLSINALIWLNLIMSVLHEIKHSIDLDTCENPDNFEITPEDCMEANNWAFLALLRIAASGKVDLECPDLISDPFYGDGIEKFYDEVITAVEGGNAEEWQNKQFKLLDVNAAFLNKGTMSSFMDYLQTLNGDTNEWKVYIKPQAKPLAEAAEDIVVKPTAQGVVVGKTAVVSGETSAEPTPSAPAFPEPQTLASTVQSGPIIAGSAVRAEVVHPNGEVSPAPDAIVSGGDVDYSSFIGSEEDNFDYGGDESPSFVQVQPHNMAPAQCQDILARIFMRLHDIMFTKCGYVLGVDDAYTAPAAVLDPVYIGDIPGATDLVMAYDSIGVNGTYMPNIPVMGRDERKLLPDGHIRGVVSKDGKIPGYVLYLNVGGILRKRSIYAQNASKKKDGLPTKWASDVQQGITRSNVFRDLTLDEKVAGANNMLASVVRHPGGTGSVTYEPLKALNDPARKIFSFE